MLPAQYGLFGDLTSVDISNAKNKIKSGKDNNDDEIGGLFRIVANEQNRKSKSSSGIDDIDSTKFSWSNLHDWHKEDVRDLIK